MNIISCTILQVEDENVNVEATEPEQEVAPEEGIAKVVATHAPAVSLNGGLKLNMNRNKKKVVEGDGGAGEGETKKAFI